MLTAIQCLNYNDWSAVAAFQAICLYFLLRVSEKNEDVTNFDIPLIETMIVRIKILPPDVLFTEVISTETCSKGQGNYPEILQSSE
jgi:hypothetical protein